MVCNSLYSSSSIVIFISVKRRTVSLFNRNEAVLQYLPVLSIMGKQFYPYNITDDFINFKSWKVIPVLFLLFLPIRIFARGKIILSDSLETYMIGKSVLYLTDAEGDLTINSVASGSAAGKFKESNSMIINFGSTEDVIWVKFNITNKSSHQSNWLLSENYPVISRVVLYEYAGNGRFIRKTGGLDYPVNKGASRQRLIVFPLNLKPSFQKTFYMSFHSIGSLPVNLEIWKPSAYLMYEGNRKLLFGIFYGALLFMIFYNLFLFFSVKDVSYLYYSLYGLVISFYQFSMDGLSLQLLSIASITLYTESIYVAGIFALLFVREFLQISKYSPVLDKLYKSVLIVTAFIFLLTLFPFFVRTGTFLTSAVAALILLINIGAGVLCLRRGNPNARIYLVANLGFFVPAFLRIVTLFGFVPEAYFLDMEFSAGILFEMMVLSFALGNRINVIKRDEEREKALMRLRIASDLHDEIGSNLSSITLSSQLIKKNLVLSKEDRAQLEDITITAKETADSIRDIIWFIDPEHDKDKNLLTRMKEAASKLLQNVEYNFFADEDKIKMTGNLQFRRNLFLIFKEILNNIAKHSHAVHVNINIKNEMGVLKLIITDDGIGFDVNTVKYGYGIKNIKNRLKEMGGALELNTSPGKGTMIEIHFK